MIFAERLYYERCIHLFETSLVFNLFRNIFNIIKLLYFLYFYQFDIFFFGEISLATIEKLAPLDNFARRN